MIVIRSSTRRPLPLHLAGTLAIARLLPDWRYLLKDAVKEAKELFWDQSIIEKLDTNPYLMCFTNGVVDFKNKVFRQGYPQDYITKTTGIPYIKYNYDEQKDLSDEITKFMR